MAGEDTQILPNETVDSLTIISPSSKLFNCDNDGAIICSNNGIIGATNNKHNNNGLIKNNGKHVNNKDVIINTNNGKKNNINSINKLGISEKNLNTTSTATNNTTLNNQELLYDDEDVICGWGPCAPKWMRCFASKQAFLVTFCITWVLQGMYYTYFVSVITTIEKLFQIQSKTTGIIMSATEIGQIGSSLLLTYYCGQGHRPRWIAWGMVLFAVSSFSASMPHFIYGETLIRQNELLFSGVASGGNSTHPVAPNLCQLQDRWINITSNPAQLASMSPTTPGGNHFNSTYCKEDSIEAQRLQGKKITTVVLAIFFVSLLGVGMGQTAVYTLGIPYIDDNVASRESPLYFAITIGVRILGPALGFILGSLCTMLYADLSANPIMTQTDPRWVGAWWLGLVLVSSMLMLASIAMFAFPRRLPSSKILPRREEASKPSLKDFPKAVKRLLKNDILMFRTASSVFHILPIAGLYTFLPKYLESQFRLTAHLANMISGLGGILVMGLGIVISGVFILRVKPNARFVAAWIAFTAIAYAIGMGILMFVGCPMDDFAGLQLHTKSNVTTDNQVFRMSSFEPTCEANCECDRNKFNPICGADGKTYFSACHAGCSNYTVKDGKVSSYSDCQCIGQNSTSSEYNNLDTATTGYCPSECNNFWVYMVIFSSFVFIHSTSEVGSMLLILRCVDPRDKAMALGLIQFAIGLFGNVPCPIVYGAVVDSACLVWDAACGERGACWLYDSNVFRMFYHGTTGGILICAFVMDIVVWYKAGSITFVDESEEGTVEEMVNLRKSDTTQPTENDYL